MESAQNSSQPIGGTCWKLNKHKKTKDITEKKKNKYAIQSHLQKIN